MPLAKVYVPAGALTPESRSEIITGITDVINTVENRRPEARKYTFVLITEIPNGSWGVSGEPYVPGK
jgi:4-oxalocrotonate tautomerase family enzyme